MANWAKRFPLACILSALAVMPARADAVADLSKATCAQLADAAKGDRAHMMVWLNGYYAGAAQRPVIERGKMEAAINAMIAACEKQPGMPLMGDQARAIMLGEPFDAGNNPTPSATPGGGQVIALPSPPGQPTPGAPKTMTLTPPAGSPGPAAKPQVR